MTEETKKLAKYILSEIAAGKRIAQSQSPQSHDLFISIENIQTALASLIMKLVDLESLYRMRLKHYVESCEKDGKPFSLAKAEILAQADDEYKNWKKVRMVYELGQEQVLDLKKFADKVM